MRYIKTYELYTGTGNVIDYEVGDIVVCLISTAPTTSLEKGKEYKVIKIYQLPEDKYLGHKYLRVDVENIETGEITKGWRSTIFKLEMEFDADKYNM